MEMAAAIPTYSRDSGRWNFVKNKHDKVQGKVRISVTRTYSG